VSTAYTYDEVADIKVSHTQTVSNTPIPPQSTTEQWAVYQYVGL